MLSSARRSIWALALAATLAGCAAAPGGAPAPVAQAQRQSIVPFTTAKVEQATSGAFTVSWNGPAAGDVAVYAGTSPQVGRERLVGRGGAAGSIVVKDLPPATRWYFALVPARGEPLVVADRSLHLKSIPNLRDAGGYRTGDGRWVRMGMIYRSDRLDRLSDADLAAVAQLGLGTVVDLRTDTERENGPDRMPAGARLVVADVIGPGVVDRIRTGSVTAQGRDASMQQANRNFVSSDQSRAAYALLLREVADEGGADLYHCTAGKDRTGWASAVLLTILGVPRETVMADYLASNGYLAGSSRERVLTGGGVDASKLMLTVNASWLEAAFSEVDEKYGSFDTYVRQGLGLTDAQVADLKARYLVGAPTR